MKKLKMTYVFILLFTLLSCDKMDDNYKQYLDDEQIYSPKISNLKATVGLKVAMLHWDNPKSDIAKKIVVDFEDGHLEFETMVDSALLENLDIKGYTVSVYTIDAFNNYSIPTSIQIFPNGEK